MRDLEVGEGAVGDDSFGEIEEAHASFRAKRKQNPFKDFYLKAKDRIWPLLSYVCHMGTTAGRHLEVGESAVRDDPFGGVEEAHLQGLGFRWRTFRVHGLGLGFGVWDLGFGVWTPPKSESAKRVLLRRMRDWSKHCTPSVILPTPSTSSVRLYILHPASCISAVK